MRLSDFANSKNADSSGLNNSYKHKWKCGGVKEFVLRNQTISIREVSFGSVYSIEKTTRRLVVLLQNMS
jgi:hypothetical protein